jgi:cytochrome c biogenesis protein CcmG/thiol:disulfide interchange protein DsbE
VVLFLAALVVLVAGAGYGCGSGSSVKASVGAPAPGFSLGSLDGRPVSLAAYRGRPVMLNFFASWCGPCREELPLLLVAQGKFSAQGLALVGVVFQDDDDSARSFAKAIGGDWPGLSDPGGKVAGDYGVSRGIPFTFFIDKDGVLRSRQIGQLTQDELDAGLRGVIPTGT